MSKFLDEFGLAHVWTNIKNYIDGKVGSESGGAEEVYSTEEVRIGTWIDGKPLYRKVINSIKTSGGQGWTYHDVLNQTWNVQKCDVSVTTSYTAFSNGSWYKSFGGITSNYERPVSWAITIASDKVSKQLALHIPSTTSFPANSSVIVILEYTKTTD